MSSDISLEQSLEQALQEMSRTADIEVILGQHPQYADQLRPLLQAARMARHHYERVPVAPGGLVAGRERFLAAAREQQQRAMPLVPAPRPARGILRGIRLALPVKLASTLLMVVLVAVLAGTATVWAARDSLPGEALYPVKLAVEDARLALASSQESRVDLALRFVEERAGEIRALAAAGRDVPAEALARMEQQAGRALDQAARVPEERTAALLMQIRTRMTNQAQQLEQARTRASGMAQGHLEQAAVVCRRAAEMAQVGLQDPPAFRLQQQKREQQQTPAGEQQREQRRNRNTPAATVQTLPQTSQPSLEPQPTWSATRTRPGAEMGPQPEMTPGGASATPMPEATARDPEETAGPESTQAGHGSGNGPTAYPTATIGAPAEPAPTSMPQATPAPHQGTSQPQETAPSPPGQTGVPQPPGGGHGGRP
jgi:hypothetical protein